MLGSDGRWGAGSESGTRESASDGIGTPSPEAQDADINAGKDGSDGRGRESGASEMPRFGTGTPRPALHETDGTCGNEGSESLGSPSGASEKDVDGNPQLMSRRAAGT